MNNSDKLERILQFGHELDRNTEIPEIEKIAGLYPRGFLSIFAAPPGTGKSWFMQYISCRLSRGGNILNGLVPNSKPLKSVILAGETGKDLLIRRLQSTCWAHTPKNIKVYDCIELQREDLNLMLNTQEGRLAFLTICEKEQPDIIFIDTLISFHTADESKQGEMTSIYSFLLKSAMTFNCAIVLNHHTRKRSTKNPAAKMTQDDVIGSSVAVRLSNCVYISEQIHDELSDDEGMPTVIVHNVKNWDKRIPDFSYKFITDEATGKIDFAINWGFTEETQKWSLRERVKNLIASYDEGASITAEIVANELGTSKDNARRYLNEFTDKGLLERFYLMGVLTWNVKAQNA